MKDRYEPTDNELKELQRHGRRIKKSIERFLSASSSEDRRRRFNDTRNIADEIEKFMDQEPEGE